MAELSTQAPLSKKRSRDLSEFGSSGHSTPSGDPNGSSSLLNVEAHTADVGALLPVATTAEFTDDDEAVLGILNQIVREGIPEDWTDTHTPGSDAIRAAAIASSVWRLTTAQQRVFAQVLEKARFRGKMVTPGSVAPGFDPVLTEDMAQMDTLEFLSQKLEIISLRDRADTDEQPAAPSLSTQPTQLPTKPEQTSAVLTARSPQLFAVNVQPPAHEPEDNEHQRLAKVQRRGFDSSPVLQPSGAAIMRQLYAILHPSTVEVPASERSAMNRELRYAACIAGFNVPCVRFTVRDRAEVNLQFEFANSQVRTLFGTNRYLSRIVNSSPLPAMWAHPLDLRLYTRLLKRAIQHREPSIQCFMRCLQSIDGRTNHVLTNHSDIDLTPDSWRFLQSEHSPTYVPIPDIPMHLQAIGDGSGATVGLGWYREPSAAGTLPGARAQDAIHGWSGLRFRVFTCQVVSCIGYWHSGRVRSVSMFFTRPTMTDTYLSSAELFRLIPDLVNAGTAPSTPSGASSPSEPTSSFPSVSSAPVTPVSLSPTPPLVSVTSAPPVIESSSSAASTMNSPVPRSGSASQPTYMPSAENASPAVRQSTRLRERKQRGHLSRHASKGSDTSDDTDMMEDARGSSGSRQRASTSPASAVPYSTVNDDASSRPRSRTASAGNRGARVVSRPRQGSGDSFATNSTSGRASVRQCVRGILISDAFCDEQDSDETHTVPIGSTGVSVGPPLHETPPIIRHEQLRSTSEDLLEVSMQLRASGLDAHGQAVRRTRSAGSDAMASIKRDNSASVSTVSTPPLDPGCMVHSRGASPNADVATMRRYVVYKGSSPTAHTSGSSALQGMPPGVQHPFNTPPYDGYPPHVAPHSADMGPGYGGVISGEGRHAPNLFTTASSHPPYHPNNAPRPPPPVPHSATAPSTQRYQQHQYSPFATQAGPLHQASQQQFSTSYYPTHRPPIAPAPSPQHSHGRPQPQVHTPQTTAPPPSHVQHGNLPARPWMPTYGTVSSTLSTAAPHMAAPPGSLSHTPYSTYSAGAHHPVQTVIATAATSGSHHASYGAGSVPHPGMTKPGTSSSRGTPTDPRPPVYPATMAGLGAAPGYQYSYPAAGAVSPFAIGQAGMPPAGWPQSDLTRAQRLVPTAATSSDVWGATIPGASTSDFDGLEPFFAELDAIDDELGLPRPFEGTGADTAVDDAITEPFGRVEPLDLDDFGLW